MTDQYAVIGNPVAHSRSPLIHAEFARQAGQDMAYTAILAPFDGFEAAVRKFRETGQAKGLNVTLPFKHEAWRLSEAQDTAVDAGAVNTLKFERDKTGRDRVLGFNTDGVGLVRDLRENLGCGLEGKRVLLMGAGGAACGVMEPLLRERPARLVVANRTEEKAIRLIEHFEKITRRLAFSSVRATSYDRLKNDHFDIVINATSAGLGGAMPPLPEGVFARGALAYDMVYGGMTPFLEFARARGAHAVDGTGMLVEQAAESFFIWRGVRPDTAPVIAMLKRT